MKTKKVTRTNDDSYDGGFDDDGDDGADNPPTKTFRER